jgi:carboxypeptidase PM20D1
MPTAPDGVPPAVAKLQALVRIPTVSHRDPDQVDAAAFDLFLTELARLFPRLHERLELLRPARHALLFRWPGRSPDRPVVLMAHLDVVPVDPADPWQHDPFGAELVDGQLWGRGTLDDKGALVAVCEAVEMLLDHGFTPAQDVWLSFGCDEEVSGTAARQAVAELQARGVRPWFVLDEGGAVAFDALPGIDVPLAVVGVTEKGVTSLELTVEGRGGHASTPVRGGPTARIARAVTRLDRVKLPTRIPEPTVELFRRLAPHASSWLRPVLGNVDRLAPALARLLPALGPEAAAFGRTTVAVTTLSGSPALNVVATTARAGVNVRVMVGETVDEVLDRLRRAVGDPQVRFDVLERNEPSPVSPVDDDAFRLLERTITEVFPEAVPVPYVMMAATDSRYFTALTPRVYRFAPFRMTKEQRASIHSFDERLGVRDLLDGVSWYRRLLEGLPEAARAEQELSR